MKLLKIFLLCFPFFLGALEEKPFVIVIPSYNNKDRYKENLNSIFEQKYHNYRVIYISDAPTDGTTELVEEYVKQWRQEHRFTLIKNHQKSGPLACMAQAVFQCDKTEVVVDLDGNDTLAFDGTLSYLNQVYADPAVWMTYGQFCTYPQFRKGFASQIPPEVITKNTFRTFGGSVTHLRTFYAGLFHLINKEDFLYEGKFIQKAGDLAYIIPILEMVGTHSRFIPDILYVYNNSLPLNDNKASTPLEAQMDRLIRSRKKYEPLEAFPLPDTSLYSQIKDIYRPSLEDYRFVQDFLIFGKRENLDRLGEIYTDRTKNMRIIGESPEEFPKSGKIPVNCSSMDRENCVVLYSTFNLNYPKGLKRLLKHILESDFKGHVLYRLGGWPDAEGGSLTLAHVPYAFKVSYFKEAQRLGFKRVLWLDVAVVPLVSLNHIFDMIQDKGCFVMEAGPKLGGYLNAPTAAYFGLSVEQTKEIPFCSAGLFGVDLSQKIGRTLIDRWDRAAHDPDAFFSPRSDQTALSIILYQLGIGDFISLSRLPHTEVDDKIKPGDLFLLDRGYIW